ncbi:hypothetical protein PAECIP111893_01169 [Paenibacillus plantiphilus]|uniref:N-acetyltransferase domain-containing protein n=1 Tax=Paenibacillus plantiphilus TaxID=2905650 RepID=A0ABM9C112_9BACL|nr:GNAT family N-acetyltransferase [Paenibacillus plantiphilus]CAH1198921.1 hypothetical protein PAECIP111893_01169 [Paenibacillus plantiphilus]
MTMNSEYRIRKAEINDIHSLSELYHAFVGQHSNTANMVEQLEIISGNPCYYLAVACDGNQVMGTAMGIVCFSLVGNCNPYMMIENVVVASEYRGKGIGRLLMHSLEEFARDNHCNYLILVSGIHRSEAHEFYETIGYERHAGFEKRLSPQI